MVKSGRAFIIEEKSTKGGTYMSEICIIVTIVVYLAAMLLVGFAYSKTNNDSTCLLYTSTCRALTALEPAP